MFDQEKKDGHAQKGGKPKTEKKGVGAVDASWWGVVWFKQSPLYHFFWHGHLLEQQCIELWRRLLCVAS